MQEYRDKKERYKERIEAILNYAQNSAVCRSKQLLGYFGEMQPHHCGQCDVCLKRGTKNTPQTLDTLREELLERVKTEPVHVQALIPLFDRDPEQIKELLRWMVEQGELEYKAEGVVCVKT
jgi:ATP-dependent DNA helicase RecQ